MHTSAEARVIASFTFIVALLLGAWTALEHLLIDLQLLSREPLGGAAVMLGVLASLGGLLYFVASW